VSVFGHYCVFASIGVAVCVFISEFLLELIRGCCLFPN